MNQRVHIQYENLELEEEEIIMKDNSDKGDKVQEEFARYNKHIKESAK